MSAPRSGWLLDTNILSELRKGARANANVRAWFVEAEDALLFTSVLVVGEIRRGVESIRRRDLRGAQALEHWLARFTETFRGRVLDVDAAVADAWGRLNVPNPLPTVDGLLAATAMVHGLTLVTRNARDIARTGVDWFDPFKAQAGGRP